MIKHDFKAALKGLFHTELTLNDWMAAQSKYKDAIMAALELAIKVEERYKRNGDDLELLAFSITDFFEDEKPWNSYGLAKYLLDKLVQNPSESIIGANNA